MNSESPYVQPNINQKIPSSKSFQIAKILLGLIVGIIFGLILGMNLGSNKLTPENLKAKPVFSRQSAAIEGKVVKVDGKWITVKNQNGTEGAFETGKTFYINKTTSDNQQIPDVDPESIDLNTQLTVNLDMVEDKFTISSIIYNVPYKAPPPIPTASGSAALFRPAEMGASESSKSAKQP